MDTASLRAYCKPAESQAKAAAGEQVSPNLAPRSKHPMVQDFHQAWHEQEAVGSACKAARGRTGQKMRSGFCHSVPALGVLRNTIKSSTQLQQRPAEAAGLASVLQTPFPAEQQTDLWLQAGSILRWSPCAKENNSSSLPSPFRPYFLSRTDIKEKGRTL